MKIFYKIFIFFQIVGIFLGAKPPFRFLIDRIAYLSMPDFYELNIKFNNETEDPYFDSDLYLRKVFTKSRVEAEVNIKSKSMGYFNLLNRTMDLCKLQSYRKKKGIVSIFLGLSEKFGNFTSLKCPVEPGYFYVKHLWLPESVFPSYTPDSQFFINLRFVGDVIDETETRRFPVVTFEGRVARSKNNRFSKL